MSTKKVTPEILVNDNDQVSKIENQRFKIFRQIASRTKKRMSKKALRPNAATKDSLTLGNKRPSGNPETSRRDENKKPGPETSRRDGTVRKQKVKSNTTTYSTKICAM